MALLFMDGFDHYVSGGDVLYKWSDYNYIQISTAYSRFSGGEGALIDGTAFYLQKDFGANYSTLVLGVAARFGVSTTPTYNSGAPTFAFYDTDGGATQIACYFDGYDLLVYRGLGTALLGTASNVFTNWNEWRYIEIKLTFNSTSGVVVVKSNETELLNLSSQNTQATANAYANHFTMKGAYSGVDIHYDDLYIDDANFHGDVRVHTFNPDSDGTHSDFTASAGSNYQCVDEGQPNDDTDYVYSSTVGHKDTYGITTGSLYTVKGAQLTNYVRKDDAGTRKIKPLCRSNSTDYQGSEVDLDTSYRAVTELWENDPADSNAWTQTKLEAAEFGLEVTA